MYSLTQREFDCNILAHFLTFKLLNAEHQKMSQQLYHSFVEIDPGDIKEEENSKIPGGYVVDTCVSILSSISLRRVRSKSGSLFETFATTSFQSPNTSSMVDIMSEFLRLSRELRAFNRRSNSTDATSEENNEYNLTRFFKVIFVCFFGPKIENRYIDEHT